MDARIGMLMREGQTVYYAFPDGYNKPAFEGLLVEVEQRLGVACAWHGCLLLEVDGAGQRRQAVGRDDAVRVPRVGREGRDRLSRHTRKNALGG